jgi:hypothetical protein
MPLMAVRAVEAGIRKLYHYEAFHPKHLEDTLVSQHIHVSNPQHFNDPWDCYPCLDTKRVTDPAYRASCIEVFRRSPSLGLTAAQQRHYERKLQADSHFFTEMLRTDFREGIRNMVVERWRIYCLTRHGDRPLMWSHYSNKHQGICLEFDAGQPVIGNAIQVEYKDALPVLDILTFVPKDAFQILVTKSPDWSYEDEYRILAHDAGSDDVPPQLPITTKDFLPLPPRALTGIIAGCRADVDTIKVLVEKYAPGLPVKRAVQAPDRYCLSIQE